MEGVGRPLKLPQSFSPALISNGLDVQFSRRLSGEKLLRKCISASLRSTRCKRRCEEGDGTTLGWSREGGIGPVEKLHHGVAVQLPRARGYIEDAPIQNTCMARWGGQA